MPTRKRTKDGAEQRSSAAAGEPSKSILTKLFAKANRGLLLDVFVFIMNIFLMRLLTRQFLDLFSQVDAENPTAKLGIGLVCVAMWALPAAGAILKRWRFHQRRDAPTLETMETKLGGCLF